MPDPDKRQPPNDIRTAPTVLLTRAAPPRPKLDPRRQSKLRAVVTWDKARDLIGTLLIVVPLTVLVWFYGERAQVVYPPSIPVKLIVKSQDPTQFVRLEQPGPEDSILIDISGPRAGVDQFVARLGQNPLELHVSKLERVGRQSLQLRPLVDANRLLREAGLSVVKLPQEQVTVFADTLDEQDVTIVPPPGLTGIDGVIFEPRQVRVRGPATAVQRLIADGVAQARARLGNLGEIQSAAPGSTVPVQSVKLDLPEDVEVLSSATINALIQIAARPEIEVDVRNIAVYVAPPAHLYSRYEVRTENTTITARIRGPREIVERLASGTGDFRPSAVVLLTREEIEAAEGKTIERQPTLALPSGVTAVSTPGVRMEIRRVRDPGLLE